MTIRENEERLRGNQIIMILLRININQKMFNKRYEYEERYLEIRKGKVLLYTVIQTLTNLKKVVSFTLICVFNMFLCVYMILE